MFRVVIDTRETLLPELVRGYIAKGGLQGETSVEQLALGDLLLKDKDGVTRVMVERKTIADLLASVKDGRYREQSFRLAQCFEPHNVMYVIEGPLPRAEKERRVVLSAMSSLYFEKGFGVWHTGSADDTAERVVNLAHKIQDAQTKKKLFGHYTPMPSSTSSAKKRNRDDDEEADAEEEAEEEDAGAARYSSVVKCVKQANVTPENITEIMLMQIPTVSAAIAAAIARKYHPLPVLIDALRANPACLAGLTAPNKHGKLVRLNKNALAAVALFFKIT